MKDIDEIYEPLSVKPSMLTGDQQQGLIYWTNEPFFYTKECRWFLKDGKLHYEVMSSNPDVSIVPEEVDPIEADTLFGLILKRIGRPSGAY